MAMSFGNQAAAMGPELQEVSTETLGFQGIDSDAKVRLLPSPWPVGQMPMATSSLLSISSRKGLLAAAGPDSLVIASTESVRKAFSSSAASSGENIKDFTPQLTISVPRLSHLAFSSDGSCLVIAAEQGGGLAVYSVDGLTKANKEPLFQISTQGTAIRALAPNPAPELAHFVALVLDNGNLMIANLQDRGFVPTKTNSQVFKERVTCIGWSVKGKQLVAGLDDGTAFQLDATGDGKAVIPRPPALDGQQHVSTIFWLTNDDFLIVYTPSSSPSPDAQPESTYVLAHRDKGHTRFEFRKSPDPVFPVIANRVPPSNFICRLKGWHNLTDALIISSVASTDVGLLTNSKLPLSKDVSPNGIVNTYTLTTMFADSRRALLPMPIDSATVDTSPIGMDLDLSATEQVSRPIPGDDDIDQSPAPLPALMLLNHEGILSGWWFVYNESIRDRVPYPGLNAADEAGNITPAPGSISTTIQSSPFAAPKISSPLAQNAPAFGSPSFSKPVQPAFGSSSFRQSAQPSAFGDTSALGANRPSWASAGTAAAAPAFGKTSFGSAAATPSGNNAGAGFGAVGSLGSRQSPWGGQSATGKDMTRAAPFGSSSTGESPFAKMSSAASPFASMSGNASPFASQNAKSSQPAFATGASSNQMSSFGTTTQPSFGSTVTIDSSAGGSTIGSKSLFGAVSTFGNQIQPPPHPSSQSTSFSFVNSKEEDMMDEGEASKPVTSGLFGSNKQPFTISSSFKPDTSSDGKNDADESDPKSSKTTSLFPNLGSLLNKAEDEQPVVKEEPREGEERSLFDIPSLSKPVLPKVAEADIPLPSKEIPSTKPPGQKFASSGLVHVRDPEPPEVTSKPTASPATAHSDSPNSSGQAIGQSRPAPDKSAGLMESPESPQYSGESGLGSYDSEFDESGEETEEHENETDDRKHPEAEPSPARKPSWLDKIAPRIESTTPPKTLHQFGSSGSFIPPPAPTPPSQSESIATTTPAGFPMPPAVFAPPKASQESPRSPSPVRLPVPARSNLDFSVPQPQPISRPISSSAAPPPPPQPEQPTSSLSDDEDERIRSELNVPIRPTLTLAPFLAHQDYAGRVKKDGLAGQIERIYRDINSMIDTLGLNARSLSAYVAGHTELKPEGELRREDLDDETRKWCCEELGRLQALQRDLESSIEDERIPEVLRALGDLASLNRENAALKANLAAVRKFLAARRDTDAEKQRRSAPLNPGMAAAQRDLRARVAGFRKRLAEVEDGIGVLRARLAARKGRGGKGAPTVEAVEGTIKKMTSMVEKRSGDIDVLEMQMRKLGIAGGATADGRAFNTLTKKIVGRTVGLIDDPNDEETEMEKEAVERCVDVRARRKVVLEQLRMGLLKKRGVVVVVVVEQ